LLDDDAIMMIDRHYPKFDCARVRRPFTHAGRNTRGDPLLAETFKANRRFERHELIGMFDPKRLQLLINGGYLELYPKPEP
jgi:hypothetical protein